MELGRHSQSGLKFAKEITAAALSQTTNSSASDNQINNKKFWEELIAYFPLYDTGHIENDTFSILFYCCACIRYRGNVSTEPLPSNDRGIFTEPLCSNDKGIHIHTQTATWSHKLTFIFPK
jgi:hypothetical protein